MSEDLRAAVERACHDLDHYRELAVDLAHVGPLTVRAELWKALDAYDQAHARPTILRLSERITQRLEADDEDLSIARAARFGDIAASEVVQWLRERANGVDIPGDGLVERQALVIVYRELARLVEEEGDA